MSSTSISRRVVILTALRLEYMAVCAHLHNYREEVEADGAVYGIGMFTTPLYTWEVCVAEIGAGNSGAGLAAQTALNYFKPNVALFVGVAGGLKELELGDVVCATKVYGYEFGKDTEDGFKLRPEIGNPSYRMIERAKAEGRKDGWKKRIKQPVSEYNPDVYNAAIAAGDKVVGPSNVYQFLRDKFGDAVAVEMEGYGFLLAMHKKPEINALVIRGISDLIYNKTADQDKKWQPIAARNASAFAFEILANLPPTNQEIQQSPVKPTTTTQDSGGNIPVPPSNSSENVKIFYSYVSEDQAAVNQLDKHLAVLKHLKWIVTSYAAEAGSYRMEQLNQADIILLMISSNFLNAFDIYEKEAIRAMERRKEGVRVIPVLLSPTDGWHLEEFGGLQVIPRDKPVSLYNNKDFVFSTIAGEIRTVVANIREERGLS